MSALKLLEFTLADELPGRKRRFCNVRGPLALLTPRSGACPIQLRDHLNQRLATCNS